MRKKRPATLADVDHALNKMMKTFLLQLKEVIKTEVNLDKFGDTVVAKLDRIERHMIEIKAEMRNIRVMYEFWADRNLSPELMEEFLREQEKKRKQVIKRVD